MTPNAARANRPASPGTRYQQLIAEHIGDMDPGLERRVSELLALTDFSAEAFERLSVAEVGSLIVLVALGESGARWAGLLLPDEAGVLRPAGRRGGGNPGWEELELEAPERLPEAVVLRSGDDRADEEATAEPFRRLMRDSGASSATLLRTRDGLRGLLLLGEPHPELTGSRSDFLEALAVSAAAALEKCRRDEELRVANRRLSLHVYQLRSLMDLTAGLHRARDETAVWDLLLHGAMGHVLASRATVVAGGRVVAAKGPKRPDEDAGVFVRAAEVLADEVNIRPTAGLSHAAVSGDLARMEIGWVVPFASGAVRGTLFLGAAGFGRELSSADRDFLTSLSGQASAAVESLHLTRASIQKEKELEVARRIQARFLPAEAPEHPGWDLWGINIPCLAVGGDYYDYLTLGGGIFVTIADVSGKGAGPALIMASVQASLRAFFRHGHTGIADAADELNDHLHQNTEDSRYMTAILARLEPATGRLDYLNAGHVHPVLVRADGSVERLGCGSTVLGLFPDIEIEVGTSELGPGDLVALYTDGLSEAEDPAGGLFDDARIVDALIAARSMSAREICGDLLSRARAFSGPSPLRDDLTVVVLKRRGRQAAVRES